MENIPFMFANVVDGKVSSAGPCFFKSTNQGGPFLEQLSGRHIWKSTSAELKGPEIQPSSTTLLLFIICGFKRNHEQTDRRGWSQTVGLEEEEEEVQRRKEETQEGCRVQRSGLTVGLAGRLLCVSSGRIPAALRDPTFRLAV